MVDAQDTKTVVLTKIHREGRVLVSLKSQHSF